MSSQNPMGGRGGPVPTLPKGEVVAAYETYPEAQSAVEVLVRSDFPVAQVSIVGSDLKTVEHVTGKLTWGRVAAAGAASGVWLGIFFGLLIEMFSPSTGFGILFAAVLLGAGFGILFGLVSYTITRRRRDYTSMTQVLATSYSIIVDPQLAVRARTLLGGHGATQAPHPYSAHPSDPPGRDPSQTAYGQYPPPAAPPRYGENPPVSGRPAPRYGEYAPEPEHPRYGENPPPERGDHADHAGEGSAAPHDPAGDDHDGDGQGRG